MKADDNIPERVARLEAISEQYDRRIRILEDGIKQLSNHVSEIDNKVTRIETTIQNIIRDIESSNRRSMWKTGLLVGILISAVNILINLALHFI